MKLNNSALQELYDTLTTGTFVFTPSGTDPIDEAFRECDDKLSESIKFATIKNLQDCNNVLERSNATLLNHNEILGEELDDAKNHLNYFTYSRNDWRDRAKHAEKEVKDLKKELQDAKTTLVKVDADRTNLQEACNKLSEENRQISELRRENAVMRELNDIKNEQIQALKVNIGYLKKRMNSLCGINYDKYIKKLNDDVCDLGYRQGQNDLWDKLQEVSDYYYFGGDDEFDTDDCEMTSMTDIIDNLNVDQFLEAYKNWHKAQEQHRLDRMRDWLHDFCANRFCEGCPLASNEYKCGRGYSFTGAKPIPDEDIERYYEKARKTWTCTLEGTIEIDKDLLKKVCGIDSDD